MGCRKLQFEDDFYFIDSSKSDNKGFSFCDDLTSKTQKNKSSCEDLKKEFSFVNPEEEKAFKKLPISASACTVEKNRYKPVLNRGVSGFRYYDADLGRFITRDPSGYPDGPNNYLYCGNNPINRIDPLGLWSWYEGWGATAKELGKMAWSATKETASIVGEGTAALVTGDASVVDFAKDVGATAKGAYDAGVEKTAQRLETQMAGGAGLYEAAAYTGAMIVGDMTGATNLVQGISGTSLDDGRQLTGMERISEILSGTGKGILTGVALGQTYDPSACTKSFKMKVNSKIKCFPAGTPVLMADGLTKAIETIQQGEMVLAFDPQEDAKPRAYEVVNTLENWTERLINVSVDYNADGQSDAVFKATGEHPFWTINRGWINAEDLKDSDKLLDKSLAQVSILTVSEEKVICDTFNLTVDGVHTFFAQVDNVSVLVHNTGEELANKSAQESAIAIQREQAKAAMKGMKKAGINRIDIPTKNQPSLPPEAITKRGTMPHAEGKGWSVDMSGKPHDATTKGKPVPKKAAEHLQKAGWDAPCQ